MWLFLLDVNMEKVWLQTTNSVDLHSFKNESQQKQHIFQELVLWFYWTAFNNFIFNIKPRFLFDALL